MTKAMQKHIDAIKAGQVDSSNIRGIRQALNNYERNAAGYSVGSTSLVPTFGEVEAVFTLLGRLRPVVVGEAQEAGLKQLKNPRYRKQLARVQHIVDDLVQFRLIDFEAYGRHSELHTPVYEAIESHGRSFVFTNLPWQAGGHGPKVL